MGAPGRWFLLAQLLASGCSARDHAPHHPEAAAMRVLVTTARPPLHLAADGSYLYWTEEGGTLWRVPKRGGNAERLASMTNDPDAELGQLVVDATDVYFLDTGEGDTGHRVLAVPKRGGALCVLADRRRMPSSLTVDATHLYWIDDGPLESNGTLEVLRVAKAGGPTVRLARAPFSGSEETDIQVDADAVYWLDAHQGLFWMPKAGGQPTVLWVGAEEPQKGLENRWGGSILRELEGNLYVVGSGASIEQIFKSGGPAVSLFEPRRDDPEHTMARIAGLAVDRSGLYVSYQGSATSGQVRRISINGKRHDELASARDPGPIAVDETHVYWIEASQRSISSMPK
jgi:hypothetical protein